MPVIFKQQAINRAQTITENACYSNRYLKNDLL